MEIRVGDYFSNFFVEGWDLDINQKLEVEYVDAYQFLKSDRLDLVCKLFYIDSREKMKNESLARELYKAHLRAFSFGSFTEPGSEEKNTLDKYFDTFDELIDDAKNNGLNAEKSVVPVGDKNSILDGSHRTAIAIYYGIPLPIVRVAGVHKIYDYEFFQSRDLEEVFLDLMAFLYIYFSKNSYVACLWPRADIRSKRVKTEELIKGTCDIVYRKQIRLNYHGLEQLMIHIYGSQEWAGNIENKFKGIPFKAKACYRNCAFTTVYVLSGCELNDMVDLKAEIREIFQMENHSIHITDTKEEALDAGKELLFQKSKELLNYGDIIKNPVFAKSIVEHCASDEFSECLTPTATKIFYGLHEYVVQENYWDSQVDLSSDINYGYVFGNLFRPFMTNELKCWEKAKLLLNRIRYGVIEDWITNLNLKAKIRHLGGLLLRKFKIIE